MFHMPNPDLVQALRRVPAEGSAEARDAAHRRDWRAVLRARRRAAPGQWLAGRAGQVRALFGGAKAPTRPGECAGAG